MHVLIIGGGIVGLTLAQGCRERGIPYTVFEKDQEDSREQGWALTLHWCLDALRWTIGADLTAELQNAIERLKTPSESLFRIPTTGPRFRAYRRALRTILSRGINLKENKKLVSITEPSGSEVQAHFADGTTAKGTVLVGADGIHSAVRRHLMLSPHFSLDSNPIGADPDGNLLTRIPVNLIGVVRGLTAEQARPVRAIEHLLFQGVHSETGNFLWFSIQECFPGTSQPENSNGQARRDDSHASFDALFIVSWPVRDEVADAIHTTDSDRIKTMKERARDFAEPFRSLVLDIPEAEVTTNARQTTGIQLFDYLPPGPEAKWSSTASITLAGDAAHAMSMYRGEGANHGILDATLVVEHLAQTCRTGSEEKSLHDVIATYEDEMLPRARRAVLLSREAAIGAHDFGVIMEGSPVTGARVAPEIAQKFSQS